MSFGAGGWHRTVAPAEFLFARLQGADSAYLVSGYALADAAEPRA
jgi:hypothetical protein